MPVPFVEQLRLMQEWVSQLYPGASVLSQLSYNDLRSALSGCGLQPTFAELAQLVRLYDEDADGTADLVDAVAELVELTAREANEVRA